MKLTIPINDKVCTITGDEYQWIVKMPGRKACYYTTLEGALSSILEYSLRTLPGGLPEVLEGLKAVRKEIHALLEPLGQFTSEVGL